MFDRLFATGYGAGVPPQAPPISPRLADARSAFDPTDGVARGWAKQTRRFTLERTDFPRIPDRTWRHIAALHRLMTRAPFGLDEDTVNRNLRIVAELLDDTLAKKGGTP